MNITCIGCFKNKPEEEFSWRYKSKGIRGKYCKACHKVLRRSYYENNLDKELDRNRNRRRILKDKFREYKSSLSCSLCGEKERACLDFHHIKGKDKNINSLLSNSVSWETLMKEIEKCVVLCSNCHRKVHAGVIVL